MSGILSISWPVFFLLGSGSAPQNTDVTHNSLKQMVGEVQQAVARKDVRAFHALLSRRTVAFIRSQFGKDKEGAAAAFMMYEIRFQGPRRVLRFNQAGSEARVTVEGEHHTFDLDFVNEGASWKLDLVKDYKAWLRLGAAVKKTQDAMSRATPFLGKEGPGKKLLAPSEKPAQTDPHR